MSLEKGHTYNLVRPKGSKNKFSEIVKNSVAKVAAKFSIDEILYEIRGLEGRDKLNAISHLQMFIVLISRDDMNEDTSPDNRYAIIDSSHPSGLFAEVVSEVRNTSTAMGNCMSFMMTEAMKYGD